MAEGMSYMSCVLATVVLLVVSECHSATRQIPKNQNQIRPHVQLDKTYPILILQNGRKHECNSSNQCSTSENCCAFQTVNNASANMEVAMHIFKSD